ncbi:hypothetical protein Tco_0742390 [Tanacetum coccineum]
MSESTFRKRFRSSYNSSPSSSPPDFPSRKRYRGTSELVEDDDEEDEEIKEILDFDSVSEDAKDEDPAAGDEGLTAGDEGPGMVVESRGLDDESHGLRDESHGLDDEGYTVESHGLSLGEEEEEEGVPEGQQQAVLVMRTAVSAPLGLGYGALRRRELALDENHVCSTFEVGRGSGSAPKPERPERVSASRQPTLTTWTYPKDAPFIVPSPIFHPMIPLTVPSPVATPATAKTEGILTELGAQVHMQGGLIRDHAVRLEELSLALFERYDRDIGELFTRSGAVEKKRVWELGMMKWLDQGMQSLLWEAFKNRFGGQLGIKRKCRRTIITEDENLKLLKSLPSAWNNIALIMRNKSDLDTLSMDDLYNNLKVYKYEIKGKSSSSSNSQNVPTKKTSTASYADDVMFSFFANQQRLNATTAIREVILLENTGHQGIRGIEIEMLQEGMHQCVNQRMSTLVFVDSEISTQADGAQSSRVPVPLPEDPDEAIRQAYLDGTDTESKTFEDPVKTKTPESPPHCLSASMAEVADMSESTFCKRFRSSYESSPSSSNPPRHPSTASISELYGIIINGDAPTVASASAEGLIPPKIAEQKLARKNELKVKITLLLAIPDEHLLKFHGIKDAKTLWEAIKARCMNSEIKGQSSSNSQNVAFVSSQNTSSTNEAVNTTHEVSTASLQGQASSLTYADDVMFSFFANQSNSVMHTDVGEKILKEDRKESEFQWSKETVSFDKTKNEVVYEEDIAFLKYDVQVKDISIKDLKNQLEEALKEKDDLKLKLEKFEESSKNLTKLINSQISAKDKAGLGYDSQMNKSEVVHSVFNSRESDVDNSPINDRFKTDDSVYKTKVSETITTASKTSKDNLEKPKTVRPSAPIIEDWDTDSDNDTSRVSRKSQSPRGNRRNWNGMMTQKLGNGFEFIKKACFVCGSFNHLIKDYDFHDNKMVEKPVLNNKGRVTGQREIRPVWNNAQRVNHQNKFTHPHPKRNFVPTAVVTKSGQVPVNAAKQNSPRAATSISTARPVNTVAPKSKVNDALPKTYSYFKAHSPVRRAFNQKSAAKTNKFNEKVNTARVNNVTTAGPKAVVNAAKRNGENVVKSSACWIWRPTGNVIDHTSKDSGSYMLKRFDYVDLQGRLKSVMAWVPKRN